MQPECCEVKISNCDIFRCDIFRKCKWVCIGDNNISVIIQNKEMILRVHIKNNTIMMYNLMPHNGNSIRSATPIIKFPIQKW